MLKSRKLEKFGYDHPESVLNLTGRHNRAANSFG